MADIWTPALHIDDSNAHLFEPDRNGVHVDANGVQRYCFAMPRQSAYGSLAWARPYRDAGFKVLSKSERIAMAKANQAAGVSVGKCHWFKSLNQDGYGWCHGYGPTGAAMVAREVMGLDRVMLAAESVAGPVVNWRNQGADPTDDVEQLRTAGACARSFLGQRFEDPDTINPAHSTWLDGWEQNGLLHRCDKFVDLDGWDAFASWLVQLLGPVVDWFNWWSHCTFATDLVAVTESRRVFPVDPRLPVASAEQERSVGWNSWGSDWPTAGANGRYTMAEGRGTSSGAIGILTMNPSKA